MAATTNAALTCPLPIQGHECIQLAHGGGGTLMHRLIHDVFLAAFQGPDAVAPHDAAEVRIGSARLAFTTDSYVVRPLFFPGGDIGSLAVHGTVNDLAMSGARPLHLSAGFILEEGLPIDTLQRTVQSMRRAATRAGVSIITGDTKVVDKGKGDGLYVNTAGIGIIEHEWMIHPASVRAGDVVIVSGDIGRHGIAVMAEREGLQFASTIESDSAAVADLVLSLIQAGLEIHCLRDLTRGGLASALNEIALSAWLPIALVESAIPVRDDVHGACELLGFDPLYVACEGRFAAFVPPRDAPRALAVMKAHPLGENAAVVGTVASGGDPFVTMKTLIGTTRIVDMLTGEQLPRIC